MPAATRRFPAPWTIDEMPACFVVRDREGQALAYVYFEEEAGRQSASKLLSKDDAWPIASNIAKLPHVPRQILKDIPRRRDSAGDD
jgi:hypothetical protein